MKDSRFLVTGIAALAAIGVSLLLDPWVWQHVELAGIYEKDWGRMLRVFGSLVFWTPLTLAAWLALKAAGDRRAPRAWLLLAGPALAGLAAEVLKLLVRRERPAALEGEYLFRAFTDRTFSTSGLGFPSSHVMVAFGGAAVVARFFPGTAAVAYLLAAGCAMTRLWARAHFASDVVGGALAGWAVGMLLWARYGNRNPE